MSRNGFPNCEREYNARQEAVEMAREERSRSMSELNSEFLARMNALVASAASPLAGPSRDNMWTLWLELPRLIALAEDRALANEKLVYSEPLYSAAEIRKWLNEEPSKEVIQAAVEKYDSSEGSMVEYCRGLFAAKLEELK